MNSDARWFVVPKAQPRARLRLYCFPYAGGSSLFFHDWHKALPSDIEIVAIDPPGRRGRILEKPFDNVGLLLDALEPAILPRLQGPFSFFGHSTGSLVAFELARRLRKRGASQPSHLLLAGCGAPHLPLRREPFRDLSDDQFVEVLRRFGGTPEAVLNQRELMELMLPLLRADFQLLETWPHVPEPPLDIPMFVYGGLDDSFTPREDLDGWAQHTTAGLHVEVFEGGHFFVTSQRDRLMPLLAQALASRGARS